MKGRFHQYLYSLLFVLLTVLGLYYGQMQQYISTDISPDFQFTTDILTKQDNSAEEFTVFAKEYGKDDLYSIEHPRYNKIRANLSENDTENDENVETSASSELLMLFREGFWHLISDYVTVFHDRKIAVSLSHSRLLKTLTDDLYIQYRVIRL
ncbi:hypothetical protein [Chryseobacterium taiwanense]|nr:hypothetical protein [Chryseobacterium taiwanense]